MEAEKAIIIGTIVTLFIVIYGCIGGVKDSYSTTIKVYEDSMQYYPVDLKKGDKLQIDLSVVKGGNVDIYILDSDNFATYNYALGGGVPDKDLLYVAAGFNVKNYNEEIELDKDGTYYIVIDNTYLGYENEAGEEEAYPEGDVVVNITMKLL